MITHSVVRLGRTGLTIPTWNHDLQLAIAAVHDRVVVTSKVDHMEIQLLIHLVWTT